MKRSPLCLPAAPAAAALLLAACAAAGSPAATAGDLPTAAPTAAASAASSSGAGAPTAPPSAQPYPTVFVPESDSFEAGLRYTCGGVSFPLEVMEGPSDAEDSGDPATVVLEMKILPTIEEWWVIERTPTNASFLGRDVHEFGTNYLYAESTGAGDQWRATGWGTCWGSAVVDDGMPVSWWIRDADWPAPGDRTLEVQARSICPGTLRDRLGDPIIRYGTDRILVILAATPDPAAATCGYAEQVAELTIELDEQVGDRALLDGERIEWRDAHIPSEPFVECCG